MEGREIEMLSNNLKLKLENIIEKNNLKDIQALMLKDAEPCFSICIQEEEDYKKIGNSRIGGYPDLPPNIQWPVEEDNYYTFIAQINLSELPGNDIKFLPNKGIMYFFLGFDDMASDIDHKVLYYNGDLSMLKKTMPPEGKEEVNFEERDFISHKVSLSEDISISSDSETADWLFENNEDIHYMFCAGKDMLWGHPETIYGGDPCEELDENGEKRWHLLLKLTSIDEVKMCWWDAGYLEFLIDTKYLSKLDFSETHACIETS
ncbi:DUF1963 domain-containing protein [Clostridium gasigenes]|uniref:DUF1963 domain-containing protein n=1 Tax=Clostridium gasigenes TaxID=94869 RepID=UPI001C0B86D6|nr:YwqG family protein [Clostridium gasigenes]MBU3107967.1 DUF1963 domain-containing protein [Clostridium gasigenes]